MQVMVLTSLWRQCNYSSTTTTAWQHDDDSIVNGYRMSNMVCKVVRIREWLITNAKFDCYCYCYCCSCCCCCCCCCWWPPLPLPLLLSILLLVLPLMLSRLLMLWKLWLRLLLSMLLLPRCCPCWCLCCAVVDDVAAVSMLSSTSLLQHRNCCCCCCCSNCCHWSIAVCIASFADVAADAAADVAAASAAAIVVVLLLVVMFESWKLLWKLPLPFLLSTAVAANQLPSILAVPATVASVAAAAARIPAPEVVESIATIERQNRLREVIKNLYRPLGFVRYCGMIIDERHH